MLDGQVIYEEEHDRLEDICDRLVRDALAKAIFIIDNDGQLITGTGETSEIDTTSLASLVAGAAAATGGIADMHVEIGSLVRAGDPVATISNPFASDRSVVEAPFTGLLVGSLENPIVYPGNPLCHLAELDEGTQRVVAARQGIDLDDDEDR